jgi:hypothetical protein
MYASYSASRPAYAIFTDTVCEGRVPAWRDELGRPVTYATERAAQAEIADTLIARLEEFIAGEREFEDAMTVEEYILPVKVEPDGSIRTEDGLRFTPA